MSRHAARINPSIAPHGAVPIASKPTRTARARAPISPSACARARSLANNREGDRQPLPAEHPTLPLTVYRADASAVRGVAVQSARSGSPLGPMTSSRWMSKWRG
jgi:hypothetical protein